MKKRVWSLALACVVGLFGPVLAGCHHDPEITRDAFKQGKMPPEAVKGAEEAMKRAGGPPTHP